MGGHEGEIGKYLAVALLSSVKFLFAPFFAESLHLSFKEALATTYVGGAAGITVFGLIGELISAYWTKIIEFYLRTFTSRTAAEAKRFAGRKFKPSNRFIVKVKKRLGLFGLALVTPCLISIPIGAIAIMSFFCHKRKAAFIYLFVSLAFWALALNTVAHVFKLSSLFS